MQDGTWFSCAGFHNRSVAASLAALDAWPLDSAECYTFAHYLWVVAWPCVAWIGQALGDGAACPWHARLQFSCELLRHDFVGFDDEGQEMDVQELAAFLATLLDAHLQVVVSVEMLSVVLLPLLRRGLPAEATSAYLVLLSGDVMSPLIGLTLSDLLRIRLLACASHLEPPPPLVPLECSLKHELVGLLTKACAPGDEVAQPTLQRYETPQKLKRGRSSREESLEDKTQEVRMLLANNVSLKHLPNTVVDAERLRQHLLREPDDAGAPDLATSLHSRVTLARHMILLDSALDSQLKQDLRELRDRDPVAFGVALATDESPPSQRRFGGYRFQVTMAYLPRWRPSESWDACSAPPLDVEPRLLDICHCPGKDGPSVMRVLDKQLSRVGVSRYDVVSMSGDGGGENEGAHQGIHSTLEADVPGYVRRRCLGHLAWRVADAVLGLVPEYQHIKRLCECLCEGVTWTRL